MRHLETDDARTPVRDGISVLLVSDVRLLRDGLVLILAETSAIRVIGTAATRAEAEEGVAKLRPNVLLLDMSIAHCIEIGSAVRAMAPSVGMVAFAAAPDEANQVACVEVGISGFVPRDAGLRDLIDAVTSVVRGEAFCSPQVVGSTFRRLAALSAAGRSVDARLHAVSAREKQIIELIDAGLSNKEIAQRLQIGVATVKNHVHNILEKLHVARRGEAAARLRETHRMSLSPTIGSSSLSSLDTARS
jgi:DNA-binding NarL/FixJ family response regulator